MPRFVILRHQTPPGYQRPLHWDFMLEVVAALRTWALAQEPVPNTPIAAEELPDHRLEYLTYEGAVGKDRGVVTQWAAGVYRMIEDSPNQWTVFLDGPDIQGVVILKRVDSPGDAASRPQRWIWSWSSNRT